MYIRLCKALHIFVFPFFVSYSSPAPLWYHITTRNSEFRLERGPGIGSKHGGTTKLEAVIYELRLASPALVPQSHS